MPYSFRIVCGFFNDTCGHFKHGRYCETGPTVYPYPRRLESPTICYCYYKGSTYFSVILRPWGPAGPPAWQPDAQPSEPSVRGWSDSSKSIKLLILLTLFIIQPVSSDETDFISPKIKLNHTPFFTPGFTLYPARISWGCFAVHTLTGTCFCSISLCIKLVPLSHFLTIPDEACLIRRNQSDNKQI